MSVHLVQSQEKQEMECRNSEKEIGMGRRRKNQLGLTERRENGLQVVGAGAGRRHTEQESGSKAQTKGDPGRNYYSLSILKRGLEEKGFLPGPVAIT